MILSKQLSRPLVLLSLLLAPTSCHGEFLRNDRRKAPPVQSPPSPPSPPPPPLIFRAPKPRRGAPQGGSSAVCDRRCRRRRRRRRRRPRPRRRACTAESPVDVIIIGAGMAGLKAAQTIEQYGPDVSLKLLEGQKRVGGRMRKHKGFGEGKKYTIEDGASWIEGARNNPVYELAEKYGLVIYEQFFQEFMSYNGTTGERIRDAYVQRRFAKFNEAYRCMNDDARMAWVEYCGSERRLMDFDASAREQLKACGWDPEDERLDLSTKELDLSLEWTMIDFEYAMRPSMTSIFAFPEETFADFDTRRYLVKDQRGYGRIAKQFAKQELRQPPVLDAEVTLVEWDGKGDYPATVRTRSARDGSCRVYGAKKVISTMSVGVLQNRPDLFRPPLNMEDNVYEMALYQKVFFTFEDKFWDDVDLINVVMPPERVGECTFWQSLDVSERRSSAVGSDPPDRRNLGVVEEFDVLPGSKILFCTITTEAARKLGPKGVTPQKAVKFLEPLKRIYGDKYREHTSIYIPEWTNDKWTYGSYANWIKGKEPDQFYAFFEQAMPVLYLSGAASCLRYWEFVHGAYFAGQKSAMDVLRDLGIVHPDIPLHYEDYGHICDL